MPSDWDPEDIKAAIRKTGRTISSLARGAGLKPNALGLALVLPRKEGEQIIAEALGMSAAVIWPSRYHADGSRITPQPPANYRSEPRFPPSVKLTRLSPSRFEATAS